MSNMYHFRFNLCLIDDLFQNLKKLKDKIDYLIYLENEIDKYEDNVENIGIGFVDEIEENEGSIDDVLPDDIENLKYWIKKNKIILNLKPISFFRKIKCLRTEKEVLLLFDVLYKIEFIDDETWFYKEAIIESCFINKNGKPYKAKQLSVVQNNIDNESKDSNDKIIELKKAFKKIKTED